MYSKKHDRYFRILDMDNLSNSEDPLFQTTTFDSVTVPSYEFLFFLAFLVQINQGCDSNLR